MGLFLGLTLLAVGDDFLCEWLASLNQPIERICVAPLPTSWRVEALLSPKRVEFGACGSGRTGAVVLHVFGYAACCVVVIGVGLEVFEHGIDVGDA